VREAIDARAGVSPRAGHGTKLSEHFRIESGQVDPKDARYRNLPLVGPNHVEPITGLFLGAETAQEQGAISGKYLFNPGSVVYSKIRPELRKAVLVDFIGLCSADMYPLTCLDTIIPEYLLDLILSDAFSAFAISCSMRTGMPKLNREQIDQFDFDLPSIAHQNGYVAVAWRVKKAIKDVSVRASTLRDMKKSLLDRGSSYVL
jgi:type I restriction enzyme S subunit